MPEKMGTDQNDKPLNNSAGSNQTINKEKLAEKVFVLLVREIEIEGERSGKMSTGR